MVKEELLIEDISDDIHLETKTARIEFCVYGTFHTYDLIVDADWLDLNLFKIISTLLKDHGSNKRLYYAEIDQHALVILINKDRARKLKNVHSEFCSSDL